MNNIIKVFILIPTILISLNSYGQLIAPKISIGLLSSDIHESEIEREIEKTRNVDNNAAKIGFYVTASSGIKLYNWLNIEFGISYQERLPLEKFTFIGQGSQPGTNTIFSFAGYPTSPQSEGWNEELFLRFPNFKYAHFELIPTFSLGKQDTKVELGLGIFYGYLLNHKTLQFSREDFPAYEDLFRSPFNITDGVKDNYNQHDIGWIPKLSISYKLTDKFSLGISAKSYVSQYALKKQRSSNLGTKWERQFNTNWIVYAGGIDLTYDLR